MQTLRPLLWGLTIALASFAFLMGSFSLSLAEGNMVGWTPTSPPTATEGLPATPGEAPPPPTASPTPSLPPPPTNCPPPAGWLPYVVQPGDTLASLAADYQSSSAELGQANCLLTSSLLPGVVVYLPPVLTPTPVPCGPPTGWVVYLVRPGDTLYQLSQAYGVTVAELRQANCLTSSLIRTGQRLYVPPWATRTPSPTLSGTPTPTVTPLHTPTWTPSPPTPSLPTATSSPTATSTSTFTPTFTFTASDLPTATPSPSMTPTTP